MISLSLKTKIILISVSAAGIFILGRATAPKAKPEIKMIDNSKSVEQAIENTKKIMLEEQHKQIVLEKHSTKSAQGELKTDVKETITYNKNSTQNIDSNTQTKSKTSDRQSVEVKQKNEGVDYTFMIGRSWADPKYDYIASIGVPIIAGIKANAGYEFNDKKIFVGPTLNF
jgi:hypothetical protein